MKANMQLADVINFEFYFAEMEKLGFQKIISKFFDGTFKKFFFGKFWNGMIGIALLSWSDGCGFDIKKGWSGMVLGIPNRGCIFFSFSNISHLFIFMEANTIQQ